jgi:hypothetical protein
MGQVRDHAGLAAVAQLVEQRTFNPKVLGSSPSGGIRVFLQALASLDSFDPVRGSARGVAVRHRAAGLGAAL